MGQPGYEGCDDGNANDADACRDACLAARCGDGVRRVDLGVGEEGYEACDDGNDVQTDACLNSCAAAACGDGIVQVNVEACDDGNNNNDDECTNDCVVAPLGSSPARAAVSCQAIKTARPQAATGTYWINPDGEGGVAPFQVSCDMSTEGGGWLRMRLNNSNQLVAAEWGRSNPFYKCADDEARMYDWVNQTQITPDSSPGGDPDMRWVSRTPT